MDLRLFRPIEDPKRSYKIFDRHNSWTRRQPKLLLFFSLLWPACDLCHSFFSAIKTKTPCQKRQDVLKK